MNIKMRIHQLFIFNMIFKKTIIRVSCLTALAAVFPAGILAQNFSSMSQGEIFQAYREQKEIGAIPSIKVPTVVEIPLGNENLERAEFAVYDTTADLFEPNMYHAEPVPNPVRFTVSHTDSPGTIRFPERMIDKNAVSYTDILLPDDGFGTAQFTITASRPITSSRVALVLDEHVAFPTGVEINAVVDGERRVLLRDQELFQNTIEFPRVSSSQWTITFIYAQPLRIAELQILDEDAPPLKRGVRFLAQPGRAYRLYLDPDRPVRSSLAQAADFALDEGVVRLPDVSSEANPLYHPADVDEDSVPDFVDNCVSVANQDQEDIDGNRRGDACDDYDRDGFLNSEDNCPNNPNYDQLDTDSDEIGDVCDEEESRFTEQYPWIPWVGMGIAGAVLVVLFVLTARSLPRKNNDENGGASSGMLPK